MTQSAVCTIIAKNYLAYARVLMASIRKFNPELQRFVFLVDRPDGCVDLDQEDFRIIPIDTLGIPRLPWFCFKYNVLELCTAVKPYALEYLARNCDADTILYLDPDIEFYASADSLLQQLTSHNVLLTPHLTEPIDDGSRPRELDILRSGAYNLGFLGIANNAETRRMLRWWQEKLYDHCYVNLTQGLFVDQRWMDLVPGLFSGVGVLRDPTYNVAYWNIGSRRVKEKGGHYYVSGRPLVFFHYSGFDPDHPETLSRHQNRFLLTELGDTAEMVLEYRNKLFQAGHETCRTWEYSYIRFANGLLIPETGRRVHEACPEIMDRVDDPFSEEGFHAFVDVWNEPVTRRDGVLVSPGITRLTYEIYRSRRDLHECMPDIFGSDRLGFLYWLRDRAKVDHGLIDPFLEPVLAALHDLESEQAEQANRVEQTERADQAEQADQASATSAAGDPDPIEDAEGNQQAGSGKPAPPVAPPTPVSDGHIAGVQALLALAAASSRDELNEWVTLNPGKPALTRAAKAIYDSRPDVRRAFPDPCGADSLSLTAWLLTYGRYEFGLDDDLVRPIHSQWTRLLKSRRPLNRVWHEFRRSTMGVSARLRNDLHMLRLNGRPREPAHSPEEMTYSEEPPPSPGESSPHITPPFGVNLIGYLHAEMGVGESVRSAVRAAKRAGIPLNLMRLTTTGPHREADRTLEAGEPTDPYQINLIHANADQTDIVLEELGPAAISGKYNIGYWAWELERFPDCWKGAFRQYQEVWTPSSFCQQAVARESPIPVICVPHAIQIDLSSTRGRAHFGVPEGRFVFLTAFDMLSVFERKNPLAVIEAFRKAFGAMDSVHLVVKINNGDTRPDRMRLIHEAATANVSVLSATFDREEMIALINAADAFVSLHRAEGFGLLLAEAMYLGKPVVTTGYSGNLDFTRPDNSFLTGYDLHPVGFGSPPYDPDCEWAEPNMSDAVRHLKTVAGRSETVGKVAARGQAFVKRQLSPAAVGELMHSRLRKAYDRVNKSAGTPITELDTATCTN